MGINFVRILVEVEIKNKFKQFVYFKNEKGNVVEQEIQYECKLVQCGGCFKYGYEEDDCGKKVRVFVVLVFVIYILFINIEQNIIIEVLQE